jgi:phage-related protein
MKKLTDTLYYNIITVDNDNIYLLHACHKQKNKTEKKDASIVRKRAKELNQMLGKKFI